MILYMFKQNQINDNKIKIIKRRNNTMFLDIYERVIFEDKLGNRELGRYFL